MITTCEDRVFEFVQKVGPVSIPAIKKELDIWAPNEVEKAVLNNMQTGRLVITSKGVQVPS